MNNDKVTTRSDLWRDMALAFIIGAGSFFVLFGPAAAIGQSGAFANPAGDLAAHVAGAYAYLDGKWSFPIFWTPRINFPDGVNIIFTDSAPLAGLIAKLIYTVTGIRWNYLGTWFFILWVGQAVSSVALLRTLGVKSRLALACAALMAVLFPPFLMRHGHLALSSHFFLLLAFFLYFFSRKCESFRGANTFWIITIIAALYTHVYLFAMVAAIYGAVIYDGIVIKNQKCYFRHGIVTACLVALTFPVSGILSAADSVALGYSTYFSDITSIFWPNRSDLFDIGIPFSRASAIGGYGYIGFAFIVTLILALARSKGAMKSYVLEYHSLVVVVLLMACYAFGGGVSLAGHNLFTIPFDTSQPPFSIFRASGRFIWPLAYLVALGAFALLFRDRTGVPRRYMPFLLIAMLGVHLVETTSLRAKVARGSVKTNDHESTQLVTKADTVVYSPPIPCIRDRQRRRAAWEFNAVAAMNGVISTSAHAARVADHNCRVPEVRSDRLLYIVSDPGMLDEAGNVPCRESDGIHLCGRHLESDDASVRVIDGQVGGCLIAPDQTVALSNRDLSTRCVSYGWSHAESWGRWTDGEHAELRFALTEQTGPRVLELDTHAYVPPGVTEQRVEVSVNGRRVGTWVYTAADRQRLQRLTVPAGADFLEVSLEIPTAISPKEAGRSRNSRELGLGLKAACLTRTDEACFRN